MTPVTNQLKPYFGQSDHKSSIYAGLSLRERLDVIRHVPRANRIAIGLHGCLNGIDGYNGSTNSSLGNDNTIVLYAATQDAIARLKEKIITLNTSRWGSIFHRNPTGDTYKGQPITFKVGSPMSH